jgi:hypothetical protein
MTKHDDEGYCHSDLGQRTARAGRLFQVLADSDSDLSQANLMIDLL